MKKSVAALLALAMFCLAGCATVRGMGEDLQNLGRGIKKSVSDEEDRRR